MKPPDLNGFLKYRQPLLTERFHLQYGVSRSDAEEIFCETLKMLWLIEKRSSEVNLQGVKGSFGMFQVYRQLAVLDEMWHTFILFTRDYTDFCQNHFGAYLHHHPISDEFQENASGVFQKNLEAQCRYIIEHLGAETAVKWFKEFPARFPSFTDASRVS